MKSRVWRGIGTRLMALALAGWLLAACGGSPTATGYPSGGVFLPGGATPGSGAATPTGGAYPPPPLPTLTPVPYLVGAATPTSAPALPGGAVPCRAADLRGAAQGEGAAETIVFTVLYANAGATACYLQGPPDIVLVTGAGEILPLEPQLRCFLCSQVEPPPATATAQAQQVLNGAVGLEPGQSAMVTLLWRNWCQAPATGLAIRLRLPGGLGQVDTPLAADMAGPTCGAAEAGSTLTVGQFSIAP